MFLRSLQTLLYYYLVCVIAFEDLLYAYGEDTNDMTERGRVQYQLLQERGSLPQYGTCWTNAIKHVNEGCRLLSEDTQAEIALHLTNCFLEMSGHETYKCEMDKKPNLRAICINGMTDRAFNVYTEFYTHTQNICFFLRGQVWHETIAEHTIKLGEQLEDSAANQENILRMQKESLELQENIKKFFVFLSEKQKDLDLLSNSFQDLQSWLLGEISWLDTFVFYFTISTLTMFFTSIKRTVSARFLMLVVLTVNVCIERSIGFTMSKNISSMFVSHKQYNNYVWLSRYIAISILSLILIFKFFTYKDYLVNNNSLLEKIYEKLAILSEKIDKIDPFPTNNNISMISDLSPTYRKYESSFYSEISDKNIHNCDIQKTNFNDKRKNISTEKNNARVFGVYNSKANAKCDKDLSTKTKSNLIKSNFEMRYNLRNRSVTPEIQKSV